MEKRTERITISLTPDELAGCERLAADRGVDRTLVISSAVRVYMWGHSDPRRSETEAAAVRHLLPEVMQRRPAQRAERPIVRQNVVND